MFERCPFVSVQMTFTQIKGRFESTDFPTIIVKWKSAIKRDKWNWLFFLKKVLKKERHVRDLTIKANNRIDRSFRWQVWKFAHFAHRFNDNHFFRSLPANLLQCNRSGLIVRSFDYSFAFEVDRKRMIDHVIEWSNTWLWWQTIWLQFNWATSTHSNLKSIHKICFFFVASEVCLMDRPSEWRLKSLFCKPQLCYYFPHLVHRKRVIFLFSQFALLAHKRMFAFSILSDDCNNQTSHFSKNRALN